MVSGKVFHLYVIELLAVLFFFFLVPIANEAYKHFSSVQLKNRCECILLAMTLLFQLSKQI